MQYLLHGEIFEVKPNSYTDKKTGEVVTNSCIVEVEQLTIDTNGFKSKGVEEVLFPFEKFNDLRKEVGKYIVIPYVLKNGEKDGKWWSYMSMVKDADYLLYDKNPFEQKQQTSEKKSA